MIYIVNNSIKSKYIYIYNNNKIVYNNRIGIFNTYNRYQLQYYWLYNNYII